MSSISSRGFIKYGVLPLVFMASLYFLLVSTFASTCDDPFLLTCSVAQAESQEELAPQPRSAAIIPVAATADTKQRAFSEKAMNPGYTPGSGVAPSTNSETQFLLKTLGYNEDSLWKVGIKVVPVDGLVAKHCHAGGGKYISGMAVKPDQKYTLCPDGQEVVEPVYKTPGKCTVVFDASRFNLADNEIGNSKAVLAHELGHCFHFIYGQAQGMYNDYLAVRPELAGTDYRTIEEIVADDFMVCRHGVDTNWGEQSYYQTMNVGYPSSADCALSNSVFDKYFPL